MTQHGRGPERAPLLTVRHEERRGVAVVSISGELDLSTADYAADQMRAATANAAAVVVDMTGLRFFASAGLNILLQLQLEQQDRGVEVRLAANHATVLRPLQLMGVSDQFVIHASVDDAVESLRPVVGDD